MTVPSGVKAMEAGVCVNVASPVTSEIGNKVEKVTYVPNQALIIVLAEERCRTQVHEPSFH